MAYRLRPEIPTDPAKAERSAARRAEAVANRKRRVRQTIAVLPTMFTLGNLLCGFFAIFIASRPLPLQTHLPFSLSTYTAAAAFIFMGMVMDALDGRIARMTRSTSDFGEQLDSMADMVTFGAAPAFLVIQIAKVGVPFLADSREDLVFDRATFVIALIYISCAALRLARFNVEVHLPTESDHSSFKGMPSPAAAGAVCSLVLFHEHLAASTAADPMNLAISTVMLVFITMLVGFAMISKLRYVHPANKFLRRGRANFYTVGMLVVIILFLSIYPWISLAVMFTIYSLSAPLMYFFRRTPTEVSVPLTVPAQIVSPPIETMIQSPEQRFEPLPPTKKQTG